MKRYKAFLGLCLAVELLSGCTDSFDDMNTTNPGAVTEANLKYVLPYVEEMTTRVDCSPYQRGDNLYAQLYCQYFSNTTSGFITDRYGYVDDYVVAGFWTPYLFYIETHEGCQGDSRKQSRPVEYLADDTYHDCKEHYRNDRYVWRYSLFASRIGRDSECL